MVNAATDAVREQRPEEMHLDLSHVTSEQDVHEVFARALHFPDLYGRNWDAFWDVLCCFDRFPRRLILSGREHVQRIVPRAIEMLDSAFADCEREHPDIAPTVTWT